MAKQEVEERRIVSSSVPASLAQRIEQLAAEADRSVSAEIRRSLVEHVRATDTDPRENQ